MINNTVTDKDVATTPLTRATKVAALSEYNSGNITHTSNTALKPPQITNVLDVAIITMGSHTSPSNSDITIPCFRPP